MKVILDRNDKLISVRKYPETQPMKFLTGDDLVLHEDNLAYILKVNDVKKFKDGSEFIFRVPNDRVSYILDAFLAKPGLLKLDAVKLEEAIQEENDKQLKMLEKEKEVREVFDVDDATLKYVPNQQS